MVQMTLRLPRPMHDELRRRAFERRISITALIRELIERGLDQEPE